MGKFGIILFAILAYLAAHAAESKKWYAPQDGWEGGPIGTTEIFIIKNNKIVDTVIFEVDDKGTSDKLEEYISKASSSTLAAAYQALYSALQAQVMAKNTSNNLNALFAGGVAQITDADDTQSSGSYRFTPKEGNKVELSLTGVQTVKAGGGLEKSQGKIGISGWDSKDGISYSIADVLSGKAEGPFADYDVLARMAKGGSMDYVKIGKLALTNGTPAQTDGFSITTNNYGRIQMIGFDEEASDRDIMVCRGSGTGKTMRWRTIDDAVFTIGDGGGAGYGISLKGYSPDLGANRYLGTGEGGSWGVHELPNVTTNNVVADEVTITTEGSPTPEQKVFRLKAVPPSAGLPYAATSDGAGGIAYIPLPEAVTNLEGECSCSQAWERVAAWAGSDPRETDMHIPTNWFSTTLFELDGGVIWLKGWLANGGSGACSENLTSLMTDPAKSDQRWRHQILTRYLGDSWTLHYLDIGDLLDTIGTDGLSLTNNAAGGKTQVNGYSSAEVGTIPKKSETGFDWVVADFGSAIKIVGTPGDAPQGQAVNEAVIGSGETTNTLTFASADDSSVKVSVAQSGGNVTVTIGVYYK